MAYEGIKGLLDRQIEAAKNQMASDLNQQLFYGDGDTRLLGYGPMQAGPRTPTWTTTPVDYRATMLDIYKKKINDNIFQESPLMDFINQEKESKDMSDSEIARKAIEKRKEERAERLAEEIGDFFEAISWSNGQTISWKVTFHETPDKTYSYVAVRGGSHWFITGDSVRHTTDSLIMKIIELNLRGAVTDADWTDD